MIEGTITELKVAALAAEHGIDVSLPFGGQLRYDQIWDMDGKLLRVQIKTANKFEHGFKIPGRARNKYKDDEIDGFATVFDNELYFIPLKDVPSNEMKLFINPPTDMNNLWDKINRAIDFKII